MQLHRVCGCLGLLPITPPPRLNDPSSQKLFRLEGSSGGTDGLTSLAKLLCAKYTTRLADMLADKLSDQVLPRGAAAYVACARRTVVCRPPVVEFYVSLETTKSSSQSQILETFAAALSRVCNRSLAFLRLDRAFDDVACVS